MELKASFIQLFLRTAYKYSNIVSRCFYQIGNLGNTKSEARIHKLFKRNKIDLNPTSFAYSIVDQHLPMGLAIAFSHLNPTPASA